MNESALIGQLDSPDQTVREQAILKISHSYNDKLLGPLSEKATPALPELEVLLVKYLQNIRIDLALPYYKRLLQSPNDETRKGVLTAIGQWNLEQDPGLVKNLLTGTSDELVLFILERIETSRTEELLPEIAAFLSADSDAVAGAAFNVLAAWNYPTAVPLILPWLTSGQTARQVQAVIALGKMSCFLKWQLLLPYTGSSSAGLRQATVQAILNHGQRKIVNHLLRVLKNEQDETVIKTLIPGLTTWPTVKSVNALIRLAALHTSPSIRKTASWSLNECSKKVIKKSMLRLLKKGEEPLSRYIIIKIGEQNIREYAKKIIAYLKPGRPKSLRYAVLESLGWLADNKFLNIIRPYIGSKDPMEAYLAVIAAAKSITSLDQCRELKDLFFVQDPRKEVLKQTLLEYMNSSIGWDPGDTQILDGLKMNLKNPDTNTRYLSVILLEKTNDKRFVPLLTSLADTDPDPVVQQISRRTLDKILQGDVSVYLEILAEKQTDDEELKNTLALLTGLGWDTGNAKKAIPLFEKPLLQQDKKILEQVAEKVYTLCPAETEDYIKQKKENNVWFYCLAKTWLAATRSLNAGQNRACWQILLQHNMPRLTRLLVEKVLENKNSWAVEPLQEQLDHIPDPDLKGFIKTAVKQILQI